jgi:hypothetical protein
MTTSVYAVRVLYRKIKPESGEIVNPVREQVLWLIESFDLEICGICVIRG